MIKYIPFVIFTMILVSCGNRDEGPTEDVLSEDTTILQQLEQAKTEIKDSLPVDKTEVEAQPEIPVAPVKDPKQTKKETEKPVKEEKKEEKKEDLAGYESATIIDKTGLDGCNFMIKLASGAQLEPVNLPGSFKKNGLPVMVKYKKAEGRMSICMAGTIVDIIDIKRK